MILEKTAPIKGSTGDMKWIRDWTNNEGTGRITCQEYGPGQSRWRKGSRRKDNKMIERQKEQHTCKGIGKGVVPMEHDLEDSGAGCRFNLVCNYSAGSIHHVMSSCSAKACREKTPKSIASHDVLEPLKLSTGQMGSAEEGVKQFLARF